MRRIIEFNYDDKFPFSNDGKNSYLAVGNVQSGKTGWMMESAISMLTKGYDVVIILGGTNKLLLEQTFRRFHSKMLNNSIEVWDMATSDPINRIGDTKVIITSLKEKTSLTKLLKSVENLYDKKIAIFDDESDFGSINTSKTSTTAIHRMVHKLFEGIDSGSFVAVTATPFADILSPDSFQFKSIIRIKPGEGYKGLSAFNNSDVYTCISEEQLKEFIDNNSGRFMKDLLIDHIKRVAKIGANKSQLLINTSLKTKAHGEVKHKIDSTLIGLKMVEGYIFNKTEITILNDLINNTFVLNRNQNKMRTEVHSVIVGGALVSRGFTFEDLLTCVMINGPKELDSADTLSQRARWFGYRDNFKDMKVYMKEKTISSFKEIEDLNSIIFNGKLSIEQIRYEMKSKEYEYINLTGKEIDD